MLARALGMLIIILNRRGLLPTIPHFVTILYGILQGLILVAVTRFPAMLPPNYYRALLRWSQYYTEEKLQVGMKGTVHKHSVPFLPLFFPLSLLPSFLLPSIPPLASPPSQSLPATLSPLGIFPSPQRTPCPLQCSAPQGHLPLHCIQRLLHRLVALFQDLCHPLLSPHGHSQERTAVQSSDLLC